MKIKETDVNGYTVTIHTDEDAQNPRKEFDNLGTMICFHRRYDLGDEYQGDIESARFYTQKVEKEGGIVLPLYLYDHSGITISTSPFSCPWDSGQVGVIVLEREKILAEYGQGKKRVSKAMRERAIKYLEGEVKTYDQYLTGEVYGYMIEGPDGSDLDSCWGFYGLEYCEDEAKGMIAHYIGEAFRKRIADVKMFIRNRVPLYVRAERLTKY